jgi:hypothetical protein
MIEDRVPVDLEALLTRRHLYLLHQIEATYETKQTHLARQDRLDRNAAQVEVLSIDERVARDEIEHVSEDIARGIVEAHRTLVQEHVTQRDVALRRQQERCDVKFGRRSDIIHSVDERAFAADLQHGREQMRREREENKIAVAEREAIVARRRQRDDELRTARVYMIGEEARLRRLIVETAHDDAVAALWTSRSASEEFAKAAEYERWLNSDEQKQLVADQERKIAEEKAAMIRKENEFKRDQQRLVSRCTHSRAGTSVFTGTFAKKLCLICRVKFDDVQGIYVRMS